MKNAGLRPATPPGSEPDPGPRHQTSTVLITLGRLPKSLDLARGFHELGHAVVIAEPHARHLAGASRSVSRSLRLPAPADGKQAYLEALASAVQDTGASLVLPVSEETMHVAHLPPLLPPGVRVLTMPPDTLLPLHHKGGFAEAATRFGLDVPETHALGTPQAEALARGARVVVKPVHSCSGRGVRVLDAGAPLPPPDPAVPHVVQRFVGGPEFSTCSLVHHGRIQATVVYRGVQFGGTVAVAFERVDHPAIESWAARFAAATRWSGFLSFDLRLDDAGRPFGIECNPRTTSGLHFLEPADVARAILDPDGAPPIRFRAARRLQQFWSCLTETQLSLFRRGGGFARNLRNLVTTPDVCWRSADPMPLLTMPWTAWPIMREAARRRVPFGEVATLDVGWSV